MVDLFLVPLQKTIIRIIAIMKNTLYLFLLSLSLSAFAAPVRIFDFSTGETAVNESLPPAKRGVETGSVVDGIDGLIDYDISFKEYVDYGILNPENPSGVCDEIYEKTGVKAMIIDASDIDCVILGKCRNVTLTDEQLCEIVCDNPAGQEGQCTPFILIRKKA